MSAPKTEVKTTYGVRVTRVEDGFILAQAGYETSDINEVRSIAREVKGMLSWGGEIPVRAEILRKNTVVTITAVEDVED